MTLTRAISGNINPYSANAVVADTTPIVNFALQQEAKKKAVADAIDKHYMDLQNINPKGMRTQDQEDLLKMADNTRNFYIQNKELINNPFKDNGKTRNAFLKMTDDQKAYINDSINTKEEDQKLAQYLKELKDKGQDLDEQTIKLISARQNPISNDAFYKDPFTKKRWGLEDIQAIYKDFNKDQWVKDITAGKQRSSPIEISGTRINTPNFKIKYKTNEAYTDKDYGDILANAALSYDESPHTKRYFNTQFHTMAEMPSINNDFKKAFGRDIQSGEDAAVALALNSIQKEKLGEKEEDNWLARAKEMENMKLASYQKKLDLKGGVSNQNTIDIWVDLKNNAKEGGQVFDYFDVENGVPYKGGTKIIALGDKLSSQLPFKAPILAWMPDGSYHLATVTEKKKGETVTVTDRDGNISTIKLTRDAKVPVISKQTITEKQMAHYIKNAYGKGREGVEIEEEDDESGVINTTTNKKYKTPVKSLK